MIAAAATLLAAAVQWPGDQEIPAVLLPAIAKAARAADGFVPKGWKIVEQAHGDLDGDGRSDLALVVRMDAVRNRISPSWDAGSKYDTNPWMLLAAFATPRGGYALRLADHRLIPRHENPNADEEFDDIAIDKGALTVRMHVFLSAGGWDTGVTRFTFRWREGGFKLIGFDRDSKRRNNGETQVTSINYLAGRKQTKAGTIESDKQTVRWSTVKRAPLIDLSAIGDGLMFDPDAR